jgi:hypothetical protein
MNTTHTHRLTFDTPSTRDYLNGGFGDLVAQCSCGQHEYVYTRTEGAYWHELHIAQPMRDARYLALSAPMPEGWALAVQVVKVAPARSAAPRAYTCPTCVGAGSIEATGAHGGRFYQIGERSACPACQGSGVTDAWAA